jgi:hypothetical protein
MSTERHVDQIAQSYSGLGRWELSGALMDALDQNEAQNGTRNPLPPSAVAFLEARSGYMPGELGKQVRSLIAAYRRAINERDLAIAWAMRVEYIENEYR